MSIIVTEGFQVNSNIAIDSRFVVGATAYGSNPPPFYSNRDEIVYKYPGLRIWDFNDNVPYVWDGSQWINENTTGAIVQNASTGNTGFQNFVTKFANNTTLLTKSLLFDDASNVGLGLTGSAIVPNAVVSNTTGTPINTFNPSLSQNPYKPGLHVAGNIRTNQYFSGDGRYIININAYNINSGYLSLDRITPPNGQPTDVFMLKNTLGTTSWDLVSNVVPVPGATNIGSGTGVIYGGVVSNTYQFKTLKSLGLDISTGTQSITLESKPGIYIGTDNSATRIYRFNDTTKIHEYYSLKSSTLKISQEMSGGNPTGNVMIEVPSSGSTDGLYINSSYVPTFDDWDKGNKDINGFYKGNGTLAKPFTNSIKYDAVTMQVISVIPNSAIQNGLDFYIGIGTGTKTIAQHRYKLLVVQSPGNGEYYVFSGDFNINNLRLKLESTVICTTTGYLIDMDEAIDPATGTYVFPGNNADIYIDIDKECVIDIRGTLDPLDAYKAVGGRLPGKGFRNSGNNVIPTTYNTGKLLKFTGDGSINSYYYSSTGVNNPNPLNIYLYTCDSTSGYQGGAANITNGNNDGNICISVQCNTHCKYQALYYIDGNSKIEFLKSVSNGDLSNTFASAGGDFYNLESFVQRGGLVRFFDAKIDIANGRRNTFMSFKPDSSFRIECTLIMRNTRLVGSADNWFFKKNIGCVNLDVTGCTSLYFSGYNLFRTTDSYTTTTSSELDQQGRGENWNGTVDKRWGSYWWSNPASGGSGPTASPSFGKPVTHSGRIYFRNNTLESIGINQNCIDLTNANNITTVNSIGNSFIEAVRRISYYDMDYVMSHAMDYGIYKHSTYLYVDNNSPLNPGVQTVVGQTYNVESCTLGAQTSTFWNAAGFTTANTTYLSGSTPYPTSSVGRGKPAAGKIFTCKAVATIPLGVVLSKVDRKTFM